MAKIPRNRPLTNHLPIFKEMEFSDDRTAAIVAASLVETSLAVVVTRRLRQDLDEREQKRLFDNRGGVFSTFAAIIDMGFALNLYDSLVRDDLDTIRDIRNQFAHHLHVRNFDDSEVAGKCDALNAPKYLHVHFLRRPEPPTRKHVYVDTAGFLATCFDRESKKAPRPLRPMILMYTFAGDL